MVLNKSLTFPSFFKKYYHEKQLEFQPSSSKLLATKIILSNAFHWFWPTRISISFLRLQLAIFVKLKLQGWVLLQETILIHDWKNFLCDREISRVVLLETIIFLQFLIFVQKCLIIMLLLQSFRQQENTSTECNFDNILVW